MNAKYKHLKATVGVLAVVVVLALSIETAAVASCAPDNGGLTLPAGWRD